MKNKPELIAFLRVSPLYKEHHYMKKFGIKYEMLGVGKFNGYVGIRKDIELPRTYIGEKTLNIENPLDEMVDVHGGITFDSFFRFDVDISPITDIPQNWNEEYRIIGFDTAHIGDTEDLWGYNAVKEETMSLYHQIEQIIKNMNSDEKDR